MRKFSFRLLLLCSLATLLLGIGPVAWAAEEEQAAQNIGMEESYFSVNGQWSYTIIHKVVVKNEQSTVARDIRLRVPLMDEEIPVYMIKNQEQLEPYPDAFEQDDKGLRYAVYLIDRLAAGESKILYQKYAVTTTSLSYDIDFEATEYNYDQISSFANYLLPDQDIQSDDPDLTQYLHNVIGGETNPYKIAKLLFAAVNLQVSYLENTDAQDAKSVLNRRTAYCEGYVNLLTALLRGAGIPARRQSGYLFQPDAQLNTLPVDKSNGWLQIDKLRHTWLEFYLPQTGWLICDPTFTYAYTINGAVNKFVDWSYFAHIPDSRRYLYFREGSGSEDKITYTSTGSDVKSSFTSYLLFGKQTQAFNDIKGHWAQGAIEAVAEKGYFSGVAQAVFAPEQTMTRAMFVTVLGRMYEASGGEIDETGKSGVFADVQERDYFAKYVSWAVLSGVAQGYDNGNFGANDPVDRQQMAKMITDYLRFYCKERNISLPAQSGASNYTDQLSISSWAAEGVSFCTQAGLLSGMPGGAFAPLGKATRAQVATILWRMDSYLQGL